MDFNNPGFWERGRPSFWTPAPGDVDIDFLIAEAIFDRQIGELATNGHAVSLAGRVELKRLHNQPIPEPGQCLS